jgi:hypothetical protein
MSEVIFLMIIPLTLPSLGIPSHVITDLEFSRHSGHPDPEVQANDQADLDIRLTRLSIEHTPVSSRRTEGGFQ